MSGFESFSLSSGDFMKSGWKIRDRVQRCNLPSEEHLKVDSKSAQRRLDGMEVIRNSPGSR